MAVRITNRSIEDRRGKESTYKVTCPKCETTFTYQKFDLRTHRRFREGYIRCPNCKTPIGHKESRFVEGYKEERNFTPLTKEEIKTGRSKLKALWTWRILFIVFGVLSLLSSLAFMFTPGIVLLVGSYSTYIGMLLVFIGITLLVLNVALFGNIIKRINTRIYDSESYYKDNKEEE